MRSILVVSTVAEEIANVRNGFGSDLRISSVSDMGEALRSMERLRCELMFVDLDILTAYAADQPPESVLQSLQQRFHSIELVIMASADKTRKAVSWVKAGATGFGIGGQLFSPGVTVDQVRQKAQAYLQAWTACQRAV